MTGEKGRVIGLDIGGANLKASDGERHSVSRSFALWHDVDDLPIVLRELLAGFEPVSAVALTMTAELADCFSSKAEGVERVVTSAQSATMAPVYVWQTAGEFVSPDVAIEFPRLTAAANWHALATWAGRMAPQGSSLLIDMGSTTTDIIPLKDGFPVSTGFTDIERLQSGELVYVGSRRTPVCSLAMEVPFRGRLCPVAAEMFATMDDVFLILSETAEDPHRCDTADGRPATREAAFNRLAHMICCDLSEVSRDELTEIAEHLRFTQRAIIEEALRKVTEYQRRFPASVLVSGEGEFLAKRIVQDTFGQQTSEILSLKDSLGPEHSRAACAFALARLGRERL